MIFTAYSQLIYYMRKQYQLDYMYDRDLFTTAMI